MYTTRLDSGKKAGIIGIVSNVILFGIKSFIGIITASVSVIADAVNNLSDALSSVFVFVGYTLSSKPADKKHPFGYARMEYLCGLFISVFVTVLGIEMLRGSIGDIASGGSGAEFSVISIIVMAATMLIKGGMAAYYGITAKKIGSQALKATAIDSLGDIFATAAVVCGMLLTPVTGKYTDAVLGCIIAVYIIILGIKLVKESSDTLLGTAPDAEFADDIAHSIKKYDGVRGIHDLVIHSYGKGRYYVSVHVEVDADNDVMESHDLLDNIENDFRVKKGIELVIHMDPIQVSDPEVVLLRGKVSDIISHISSEHSSPISMHDFRVVFGVTHSNLIFDIAITDSFPTDNKTLCEDITKEIKKLDEKYNAVITVDRDYSTSRFGERI